MGHQHGSPKRLHCRRIRRPCAGPLILGLCQVWSRFERSEQGEIQSVRERNESGGLGSLSERPLSFFLFFRCDEYSKSIYRQFSQARKLGIYLPGHFIIGKI